MRQVLDSRLLRDGEREVKRTAILFAFRLNPNAAPMYLDDPFDERQSHACAVALRI